MDRASAIHAFTYVVHMEGDRACGEAPTGVEEAEESEGSLAEQHPSAPPCDDVLTPIIIICLSARRR